MSNNKKKTKQNKKSVMMLNVQTNNYFWLSAAKAWMIYNLHQQKQRGQGHMLTLLIKSSSSDSDSTTNLLCSLEENKPSESFHGSQT